MICTWTSGGGGVGGLWEFARESCANFTSWGGGRLRGEKRVLHYHPWVMFSL